MHPHELKQLLHLGGTSKEFVSLVFTKQWWAWSPGEKTLQELGLD